MLNGAAKSHWIERKTQGLSMAKTSTKTIHYQGNDVYLNVKIVLLETDEYLKPIELSSGTHNYEFSFRLPSSLPGSIKTKHSYISYSLEVALDASWNHDKEFKTKFSVIGYENLNYNPSLKLLCKNKVTKKFYCFPCESEPLVMTVTLPFTGFVPGQKIHVSINYDNKSNVKVQRTAIVLKKFIRTHR